MELKLVSQGVQSTISNVDSFSIFQVQKYQFWPVAPVPGLQTVADKPVELGVKFRVDIPAKLLAIRFYKHPKSTEAHVVNLWNRTGTNLATATGVNETASGWQQVQLTAPIALLANTTYIASYHCNGWFADNTKYFATKGVDNGPLHALMNGVDGPQTPFSYGATSIFPTQTWDTSNYWVDVVVEA